VGLVVLARARYLYAMQRLRKITTVVLIVLAVVVVLQNTTAVSTRFLLWEISAPRAVMLAVTLLIGFVLGLLAGRRSASKRAT